MSEWKEVTLMDVTSKIGDGLHGTPKYDKTGNYYFVNGNNLSHGEIKIKSDTKKVNEDEFNKYQKPLSDNTILLGINGTIGNLAFYKGEKCVLGKSACYINVNEYIDKRFLYYNFVSTDFQSFLEGIATGTTIPNVPLKGLREYSFLLPPLPEQRAIAGVLSSLDDKIDLLHRQNKTLEAMAEALFRQWFVEPCKDGLPEGWEEGKIGDFVNIQRGISYSGKTLGKPGEGLPMHSLNSIDIDGNYKYDGIKYFVGLAKISQILSPGDLLIINTDMTPENRIIGWPVFVPEKYIKSVCTHHLYRVHLLSNRITKLYLYYLLRSKEYREELANASNGTTVSMLSKGAIENIKIIFPSLDSIQEFGEQAKVLMNKRLLNQYLIESIIKIRDTLLPKLMNGEVRVAQ